MSEQSLDMAIWSCPECQTVLDPQNELTDNVNSGPRWFLRCAPCDYEVHMGFGTRRAAVCQYLVRSHQTWFDRLPGIDQRYAEAGVPTPYINTPWTWCWPYGSRYPRGDDAMAAVAIVELMQWPEQFLAAGELTLSDLGLSQDSSYGMVRERLLTTVFPRDAT